MVLAGISYIPLSVVFYVTLRAPKVKRTFSLCPMLNLMENFHRTFLEIFCHRMLHHYLAVYLSVRSAEE